MQSGSSVLGDRETSDAMDGLQVACRVGGKVRERHLPAWYQVEALGKARDDRIGLHYPRSTTHRQLWLALRRSNEAPNGNGAGPGQCDTSALSRISSDHARVFAKPGGRGCDGGRGGWPAGDTQTRENQARQRIGR